MTSQQRSSLFRAPRRSFKHAMKLEQSAMLLTHVLLQNLVKTDATSGHRAVVMVAGTQCCRAWTRSKIPAEIDQRSCQWYPSRQAVHRTRMLSVRGFGFWLDFGGPSSSHRSLHSPGGRSCMGNCGHADRTTLMTFPTLQKRQPM
jgi:hypothetical protein